MLTLPVYHHPSRDDVLAVTKRRPDVDFDVLMPTRLPFGYRLESAELIPYARDLLFMTFVGQGRRSFRFSQRIKTVSLDEEIRITGVPHSRANYGSSSFVVVAGSYEGEPGDVWHWHQNRRVIKWEQDTMTCEITIVLASSPSVETCLKVASSVRPLPANAHTTG